MIATVGLVPRPSRSRTATFIAYRSAVVDNISRYDDSEPSFSRPLQSGSPRRRRYADIFHSDDSGSDKQAVEVNERAMDGIETAGLRV